MPRKKINPKKELDKVLEIVNDSISGVSIREVKLKLEEEYRIKRSPQVVKRYLQHLKKMEKIK